jgi:glycosyltransferase involved in cell wall biosynthesis
VWCKSKTRRCSLRSRKIEREPSDFARQFDLGNVPLIVYTGNLAGYQGVELLLRAMAVVQRKHGEAKCLIVGGEPPEIARLREMAEGLDLLKSVVFCGKRPIEEMPAFMSAASVLVSPRVKGENTALKIYTYMQSGKPIVATRLPTHTQVLDDECAILVRATPDDMAEGILRVLHEPLWAAALGREAQARVAARYSLASFRHKVRTAYSELVRMQA